MPRKRVPGGDPWLEVEETLAAVYPAEGVAKCDRQAAVQATMGQLRLLAQAPEPPRLPALGLVGPEATGRELGALADALDRLGETVAALHQPAIDELAARGILRHQFMALVALAPTVHGIKPGEQPPHAGRGRPPDARAQVAAGVMVEAHRRIAGRAPTPAESAGLIRVACRALGIQADARHLARSLLHARNTPERNSVGEL
jgi:hypothetical protein